MRRGIVFDGRAFDLGKLSDKRDIIAMSTSAMSGAISTVAISTGGARRDRTDDLLLAKQALSQLSYGPGPSADGAPDYPMQVRGGPGKI